MPRKIVIPVLLVVAAIATWSWYVRRERGPAHYTGFVEGEERVIRAEVSGRVLEMRYVEGEAVPADAVLATLDDRDIRARLQSKQEEIAVLDAELQTQEERVALIEQTWRRDVSAREAAVRGNEASADLAARNLQRQQRLREQGVSAAQELDERRTQRDEATSAVDLARQLLGRAEAEERQITVARREIDTLRAKRALSQAQLGELQVTLAKYTVRAPGVPTTVQTQFVWPGELAQPGTALAALLDPRDKYVQLYVPVVDVGALRVGQRVAIELDSRPGERVPGEISFIADRAHFTPEKIESRSDRLGQVYRVKVRILEQVERFQPGTEGNVYVLDGP